MKDGEFIYEDRQLTLVGSGMSRLAYSDGNGVCVKVPVFSFQKLNRIDPALAPEMKSTGEVLGIDTVFDKALVKGFLAAGYKFPVKKEDRAGKDVLISLNDHEKPFCEDIARMVSSLGYRIVATTGTHNYLKNKGINSKLIENFD